MLELYHNINSVCAQKVRIALEEKGQEAKEHLLTLQGDQNDPAYLKLDPNGVVPTLVHDGNVIAESSLILYYIDEAFPDPPLMPNTPAARHRVPDPWPKVQTLLQAACPPRIVIAGLDTSSWVYPTRGIYNKCGPRAGRVPL